MAIEVLPDENRSLDRDAIPNNDRDLRKWANDEKFMNQELLVEFAASSDENVSNHFILNVNGTNQPVIVGVPMRIKRKYVEVAARMKETRYRQKPTNWNNTEDSNAMHPRTALVRPFQVLEDPAKGVGRAWLNKILAEPA